MSVFGTVFVLTTVQLYVLCAAETKNAKLFFFAEQKIQERIVWYQQEAWTSQHFAEKNTPRWNSLWNTLVIHLLAVLWGF